MYRTKKLGQNFLVNEEMSKKIISSINIKKTDVIAEIGPGKGALTKYIKCNNLYLIEIDTILIKYLQTYIKCKNIFNEDILKFNLNKLNEKKKIRIIGNIPYKISTKIIFHLIKFKEKIHDVHLTIQKELFDRIIANTHSKNYGKLSIFIQYHFNVTKVLDISKNCFHPKPKINSIFMQLVPNINNNIKNYEVFKNIINNAFSNRRKKINKIIKNLNIEKKELMNKRPEEISINEYIEISNIYCNNLNNSENILNNIF